MRIKALEIHGFKSFAEPAKFAFGRGITGVVGPNGCGKSNIIDAIRWVMGEMSAKHLRGRAMQDVIFAGSDSRGPSGLAEVTLTLHNEGDAPPQYSAYEDIAVSRRLYRDGTSEYRINQVPCRLRDITDLFLGTGVGTKAYSIIEQGRIGFIVSARPEDRRSLIEEVAGITKFKARKRSAERRMEATEQNLRRVRDIVSELERQLGSLQRQAKKAERYKRLKAELLELDVHIASTKYLELRTIDAFCAAEQHKLEVQLSDVQTQVGAEEALLETEGLAHQEVEDRLQQVQSQSAEADSEVTGLERDIAHAQSQIEAAASRLKVLAAEAIHLQQSQEQCSEQIEESQRTLSGLDDPAQLERSVQEQAEGLAAEQSKLQALLQNLQSLRAEVMQAVQGSAQKTTSLAAVDQRIQQAQQRLSRYDVEQNTLQDAKSRHVEQAEALKEQLSGFQQQRQTEQEELAQTQQRLQAVSEQLETERTALSQSQKVQQTKQARLDSLVEIAQRFEGYSEGMRALLGADGDAPILGSHRLLTDVFQVQPQYEAAIEAVLGEKLQSAVVPSFKADALAAFETLRTQDAGRARLLVSKESTTQTAPPSADVTIPGRSALDCIQEVQAIDLPLVKALLGHIWIVEDASMLSDAYDADIDGRYCYVSHDGTVLRRDGVLEGGSNNPKGLLSKEREMRSLRTELEELTVESTKLEQSCAVLDEQWRELQQQTKDYETSLRESELHILRLDKDRQAEQQKITQLSERIEVLSYEREQRQQEIKSAEQERQELQSGLGESESAKTELSQQLEDAQAEQDRLAQNIEQLQQNLTGLKVQLAERSQEEKRWTESLERARAQVTEYQERLEKGADEQQQLRAQEQKNQADLAQWQHVLTEKVTLAQTLRQELQTLRERFEQHRLERGDKEQHLREVRRQVEVFKEALVQTKMDRQRLGIESQTLMASVQEKHDLNLFDFVHTYHLQPPPGPEQHQRVREIQRSLKNIGSVNLMAIEECKDVEARYAFLSQQQEDLEEALKSLRRAILRINKASRERFIEAFKAVNDMFMKLYPRLFRGGEARLELLEADDVLEAGVDIVAQPPGKKLQNVSLLSGGEKAMTATALVFSIFLIKPSPFCVLDEVDAPLDDANVSRFNELLREMSQISQFIVITHNKLTMTEADKLYGVTMEEPGMSKLVSVDLDGYEKPNRPKRQQGVQSAAQASPGAA